MAAREGRRLFGAVVVSFVVGAASSIGIRTVWSTTSARPLEVRAPYAVQVVPSAESMTSARAADQDCDPHLADRASALRRRLDSLQALRRELEETSAEAFTYTRVSTDRVREVLETTRIPTAAVELVDCSADPCVARFIGTDLPHLVETVERELAVDGVRISGSEVPGSEHRNPTIVIAVWDDEPTAAARVAVDARLKALVDQEFATGNVP